MTKYWFVVFVLLLQLKNGTMNAQTYPSGFVQVQVANTISNPTAMAFASDGRLFVAQQSGALRIIKDGALLATPFVSLSVSSTGERGLIGIAIDPDFATNKWIYLYHTVPGSPIHNRITRFTANGDVALAGSGVIVLELDPLSSATNHNGGAMHFGQDGKLYVAVGENANTAHAQNLDTYHGKLLRINKDGTVPEGNPFLTGSEQKRRVWAYGLRNPYTFSVHPATGRILVNDVGQSRWEEVNDATTGGKNFGWPATEGNFNAATYPAYTRPIYSYSHATGDGSGCAITGGTFFYPPTTNYPASYFGQYFIQDLCGSWINALDVSSGAVRSSFATGIPGNALAMMAGPDGNLYYLSRNSSAVYKIVFSNATMPYIILAPQATTVAEGHALTLSVGAAGTSPLLYQWFRNGTAIGGAVSSTYTVAEAGPADAGQYTVQVSNSQGNVTSNAVTIAVIANRLPVASIVLPATDAFYRGGDLINFSGGATDVEDGTLPASSLQWNINFHHDTHKHDEPPIVGVAAGSFEVPIEGETSSNVWYRIILTATDANGLSGKDSVDVHPLTSTMTLSTDPEGLQVTLDGQPVATPLVVTSVQGLLRTIGVPSPQEGEQVTFIFDSWSDGNAAATRTIATPNEDFAYVARFLSVVSIEDRTGNLAAFPNPSREGAIWLRDTWKPPVTVRMVDVLAREVARTTWTDVAGNAEQLFAYGKLNPAIYSLIIEQAGSSRV
ncbi:MAG TPA: PQQ-dependent sugar dehydrogenase, partial [Chryseolinea sp.]|nr:PQQ-dependent sugar dehydrogenase [Chryseolinea sp.]